MIKLFLVALFMAFTGMSSCAQDDHKKFANESEVPRITVEDAKKAFDEGAVFIDVRDAGQYKAEHIKGALNIQKTAADSELEKVPKGKKIIVYCS